MCADFGVFVLQMDKSSIIRGKRRKVCVERSIPHSLQFVLCGGLVVFMVLTNRILCEQVGLFAN